MPFPNQRLRRFRRTAGLRQLVRQTRLHVDDLIQPLFVTEADGLRGEISSMPGVRRWSVDELPAVCETLAERRVPAVLLFGLPSAKDDAGAGAYATDGVIPQAIRRIKSSSAELVIMADVCLCEYTDHGHCGVVADGSIDNDRTLTLLARAAAAYAAAGVDVVAPSAMMDGMVGAIRGELDEHGFQHVAVLSYAAKYASSFYGPFREAAQCAPRFGDRRTHQMDPANHDEAIAEMRADLAEGADALMVKPAMPYLDVIRTAQRYFPEVPLAAYQVSGEYAMIQAAAERGWIDGRACTMESLTAIKRAGADMIITYFASDIARDL